MSDASPVPMAALQAGAPVVADKTLRHPHWLLFGVCVLALMATAGAALPYPILAPIFVGGPADDFTRWMGLPPELLIGLALAVNPAGILLGSLVVGPMSDRFGRRRTLAVTLSATLACYALSALALARRDYPLFVLSRFATGLTEGNVAVVRALLADWHPQLERTRSFAWLNASLYSGWLLGPLMGGLTLPLGEPVPFMLAALVLLPCLLLLWRALPVDAPLKASAAPRSLWALLRNGQSLGLLAEDPVLRRLALLHLVFTLGVNALYEFAPLWMLQQAGFGGREIGWVTAGQCAVMTLASVLAVRVGSASHPLSRAARWALLAAAGLLALAAVPASAGVLLIMGLGLPLAFFNALLPAWMSERFADHGQGRVMGLLTTMFCVSNTAMALLGGWLGQLSARWIMALGGVSAVLAALALQRFAREEGG